jgi:thiol:disulfide interchange protein DsbD
MGVVAAPCIGPLVAALLIFVGAQQSAPLGFGLFFMLGLGMGAPYVALAALAGRLRRLPRAGEWLAWVERLFAFLLLGMALYFAAPLLPPPVLRATGAALLASAGVVLGFVGATGTPALRWARRAVGAAVVAIALGGLLTAETKSPIAWTPFSDEALTRAVASRRPVLIDVEAEWCLPCREMDRTTFRDPGVVRAAASFVALRLDVTTSDEHVTALMERLRVAGVPTYLLLDPAGAERRRLVGFVAADEMRAAMEEVIAEAGAAVHEGRG